MKKNVFLFLGALLIFHTGLAFADSERIKNNSNGHFYQRIDTEMNWSEAKTYCERMGGHLVTITSEDENQFVYENFAIDTSSDNCWIGASDEETEGKWQWVTGEQWNYSNWDEDEPNDCGGNEDYAVISNNYRWNDTPNDNQSCTYSTRFYSAYPICEWDNACYSQTDLDAQYEAGKQYCIDNPAACGLQSMDEPVCADVITYGKVPSANCWVEFPTPCDVPEGWESISEQPEDMCGIIKISDDDRYDEGYQDGIATCTNEDNGITLSPELNMHVPMIRYSTLLGDLKLWGDFEFTSGENGELLWELVDFGEIE